MGIYNVGDIVKLRDDLQNQESYGGTTYNDEMDIMKNEPIEIKKVYGNTYRVFDKYNDGWLLTDEMIEGLWEECKSTEQVSKSEGKYKLIDILNKIANGELKEGTKIIWGATEYVYKNYSLESEAGNSLYKCIGESIGLLAEVELIEPNDFTDDGKMTECKHIWHEWLERNSMTAIRRCEKCGITQDAKYNYIDDIEVMAEANQFREDTKMIETTDNTKIEELIDWYQLIDVTTDEEKIHIVWDRLNDVIRKLNKEE